MKLFGGTKSKITKDKNGENAAHLEINELVLIHCNIFNNDYQQDSRVLYTFVPNKSLVNYQILHPKILCSYKLLIQNIHVLKSDLLIKILNNLRLLIELREPQEVHCRVIQKQLQLNMIKNI